MQVRHRSIAGIWQESGCILMEHCSAEILHKQLAEEKSKREELEIACAAKEVRSGF